MPVPRIAVGFDGGANVPYLDAEHPGVEATPRFSRFPSNVELSMKLSVWLERERYQHNRGGCYVLTTRLIWICLEDSDAEKVQDGVLGFRVLHVLR